MLETSSYGISVILHRLSSRFFFLLRSFQEAPLPQVWPLHLSLLFAPRVHASSSSAGAYGALSSLQGCQYVQLWLCRPWSPIWAGCYFVISQVELYHGISIAISIGSMSVCFSRFGGLCSPSSSGDCRALLSRAFTMPWWNPWPIITLQEIAVILQKVCLSWMLFDFGGQLSTFSTSPNQGVPSFASSGVARIPSHAPNPFCSKLDRSLHWTSDFAGRCQVFQKKRKTILISIKCTYIYIYLLMNIIYIYIL